MIEKHQCVAVSHAPPTGATQACALTGNQTSDPFVHRLALSPPNHTSQGQNYLSQLFFSGQYPDMAHMLQLVDRIT